MHKGYDVNSRLVLEVLKIISLENNSENDPKTIETEFQKKSKGIFRPLKKKRKKETKKEKQGNKQGKNKETQKENIDTIGKK